jgi:hypothetical protein
MRYRNNIALLPPSPRDRVIAHKRCQGVIIIACAAGIAVGKLP